MKKVIVDYAKLTNEILTLLVERFPDGYDDSNIIRFKNAKNETIEAVEVRTEDTIFLVKVSTKLTDKIENFEDEYIDINIKNIDISEDEDDVDIDISEDENDDVDIDISEDEDDVDIDISEDAVDIEDEIY